MKAGMVNSPVLRSRSGVLAACAYKRQTESSLVRGAPRPSPNMSLAYRCFEHRRLLPPVSSDPESRGQGQIRETDGTLARH